jgi:hypothetical protein
MLETNTRSSTASVGKNYSMAPPDCIPQRAKVLRAEWEAEIESRIDTLRAKQHDEGHDLTRSQAAALAGEWYKWFVAQLAENPGPAEYWNMARSLVQDEIIEANWRCAAWSLVKSSTTARTSAIFTASCRTIFAIASSPVRGAPLKGRSRCPPHGRIGFGYRMAPCLGRGGFV